MNEIWKDIPEYEGLYQASNFGRVKSLKRKGVLNDRILKSYDNGDGYFVVNLYLDKKPKHIKIHKLIALVFINNSIDKGLVVDHIDNTKSNNMASNLQLISHRQNCSKDRKNGTSKYIGVYFNSHANKFHSRIQVDGKQINLGLFENEKDASDAYKNKLEEVIREVI